MRNNYPYIDLHRHLDGNIRLQTIIDLGKKHGLPLPSLEMEELRSHVQIDHNVSDLMEFIAKFEILQLALVDLDAVYRVAYENVEDAHMDQLGYVELRFSPFFMSLKHNLDVNEVTKTICKAINDAKKDFPVLAKPIVIMSRGFGDGPCWQELDAAIDQMKNGVVAIDLAGDEKSKPGSLFVKHFDKARANGLLATAHAGEADGAHSVKQAVLDLKVQRIGHGVRAIEDSAVMELLLERKIGVEMCPTSNFQTSTVASIEAHPIKDFLMQNQLVSLNTDDPSISGIDLSHEFKIAKEVIGLSEPNLRTLQENALNTAFISKDEKKQLLALE